MEGTTGEEGTSSRRAPLGSTGGRPRATASGGTEARHPRRRRVCADARAVAAREEESSEGDAMRAGFSVRAMMAENLGFFREYHLDEGRGVDAILPGLEDGSYGSVVRQLADLERRPETIRSSIDYPQRLTMGRHLRDQVREFAAWSLGQELFIAQLLKERDRRDRSVARKTGAGAKECRSRVRSHQVPRMSAAPLLSSCPYCSAPKSASQLPGGEEDLGRRIPAIRIGGAWMSLAVLAPRKTAETLLAWLAKRPRSRTLLVKITTDAEGRWDSTWSQEQPEPPPQPVVVRRLG